MFRTITFLLFFSFLSAQLRAQDVPERKMHRNVTSMISDEIAPAISADGNTIIYMVREGRNPEWLLFESRMERGTWTRGEPVDPVNKSTQLVHPGGYSLSSDGDRIYFSYKKYGGLGGFDIWYIDRQKNGKWGAPTNLAKPINSGEDEANPFVSVDGRYLYFMRCQSLKPDETECCKLMVAEKTGATSWGDPEPLPAPINKGCESTPRVMTDGRTMFFASKRAGGKGGLDIYRTQKDDLGKWSEPKPVNFLNTPDDDRFTAMSSNPKIVYYAKREEEHFNLYEAVLPESLRPLPIQHIRGKITSSSGEPVYALVVVENEKTGKNEFKGFNDKKTGEFQATIVAGNVYDFSIIPIGNKHIYFSEHLDLSGLKEHEKRGLFLKLDEVKSGNDFQLMNLPFKQYKSTTHTAEAELRRFYKLMDANEGRRFNVFVYDTVPEKPTPVDSVALRKQYMDSLKANPQTVYIDSLEKDTVQSDSLAGELLEAYESHYQTLKKERKEKITEIEQQLKQLDDFASWIKQFYTDKNIAPSRLSIKGVRRSEVPLEKDTLSVKGIAVQIE